MSRHNSVLELYGEHVDNDVYWRDVIDHERCPFIGGRCVKTRKSSPDVTIGTCTVKYRSDGLNMCICPHRMKEDDKVFTNCVSLMSQHSPTNELKLVKEVEVQGGNVDYFLISVDNGGIKKSISDYVGIELQALDSTGTVWPERQKVINRNLNDNKEVEDKSFGMNWKMTAKTSLMQMHHKVETFDSISKHLVLVVQDELLEYMKEKFRISHMNDGIKEDPFHIHSYRFVEKEVGGEKKVVMEFDEAKSTDVEGVEVALGLKGRGETKDSEIKKKLKRKI